MRAKLLLALLASALALLAVEVGLRAFERATGFDFFHVMLDERSTTPDTELRLIDLIRLSGDVELIYELAPRLRGRFIGAPVATDAHGNRAPESGAPPAGRRQLVGIGDSHLFGWGVAWQDTFLAQIAARYAREHGGEAIAVTNLGVPGYNTHQQAEVFAAKALALEPDAVIVLASQNDAGLANFIRVPRDPWTLERSYLVDFVEIRAKQLLRAEAFRNRFEPHGLADVRHAFGELLLDEVSEADLARLPASVRHMVGTAAVDRALDRIAALARERGVPVVLAFYDEPGGERLRERMFARARAGGLRVADLAGPVAASGEPRAALALSPGDPHPTPLHHRLIADALYEQHVRALLEAAR